MITKRLWIKKVRHPNNEIGMRGSTGKWAGYYLFGFIPLYRKMFEINYY